MKKNKSLKSYLKLDGGNFTNPKHEKMLCRVIKIAGKYGWRYCLESKRGKTFCVIEASHYHPKGKLVKEEVTLTFTWIK